MNSSPEYHVPPSLHDPQPPSRGQVVRYILLGLGTVILTVFNIDIIGGIYEDVVQSGFMGVLQIMRADYETPPLYALVPLGMMGIIVLWLDRHSVIKPRRKSNHRTTLAYRILLGWGIVELLLFFRMFTYGY